MWRASHSCRWVSKAFRPASISTPRASSSAARASSCCWVRPGWASHCRRCSWRLLSWASSSALPGGQLFDGVVSSAERSLRRASHSCRWASKGVPAGLDLDVDGFKLSGTGVDCCRVPACWASHCWRPSWRPRSWASNSASGRPVVRAARFLRRKGRRRELPTLAAGHRMRSGRPHSHARASSSAPRASSCCRVSALLGFPLLAPPLNSDPGASNSACRAASCSMGEVPRRKVVAARFPLLPLASRAHSGRPRSPGGGLRARRRGRRAAAGSRPAGPPTAGAALEAAVLGVQLGLPGGQLFVMGGFFGGQVAAARFPLCRSASRAFRPASISAYGVKLGGPGIELLLGLGLLGLPLLGAAPGGRGPGRPVRPAGRPVVRFARLLRRRGRRGAIPTPAARHPGRFGRLRSLHGGLRVAARASRCCWVSACSASHCCSPLLEAAILGVQFGLPGGQLFVARGFFGGEVAAPRFPLCRSASRALRPASISAQGVDLRGSASSIAGSRPVQRPEPGAAGSGLRSASRALELSAFDSRLSTLGIRWPVSSTSKATVPMLNWSPGERTASVKVAAVEPRCRDSSGGRSFGGCRGRSGSRAGRRRGCGPARCNPARSRWCTWSTAGEPPWPSAAVPRTRRTKSPPAVSNRDGADQALGHIGDLACVAGGQRRGGRLGRPVHGNGEKG